jgi:hypothetical protein
VNAIPIYVEVREGLVQSVYGIPRGIEVHVLDYDQEELGEPGLERDKNGHLRQHMTWSGNEPSEVAEDYDPMEGVTILEQE